MQLTSILLVFGAAAAMAKPFQAHARGDGYSSAPAPTGPPSCPGGGSGGGGSGGSSSASAPATTSTATPGHGGGGSGGGDSGNYVACTPGLLYSNAQCCATDVLGVADLDCENPSAIATSPDNFKGLCAAVGKTAACCVIPVAGQDVLCTTPQGL